MDENNETARIGLSNLLEKVGKANRAKGFHNTGDALRSEVWRGGQGGSTEAAAENLRSHRIARLALITTEVAEAIEEVRKGRDVDETYYPTRPYTDQYGAVHNSFEEEPYKPEGVLSELADILIRVLDFAYEEDIDLVGMVFEKLNYNESRPYLHGKKM